MLRAPTKSAILYQSFFSETGLENSREFPVKSAVFFREFDPEIPAKFDFFPRPTRSPVLSIIGFQNNFLIFFSINFNSLAYSICQLSTKI